MKVEFQHLKAGHNYVVTKQFYDFEKKSHSIGEQWLFIGSRFVPYDDGLLLYVIINGSEQQVKLQWLPQAQGKVLDNLEQYVREQ